MILKNLLRRRIRSLLTILGVAIGVAAVVALSAFGEGLASGFEQLSGSSGADLTIAQRDAMMTVLSAVDESIGVELANRSGIAEVTGTVVGIIQTRETPYFFVFGEDPRGFTIQHYRLIEGRSLTGRHELLLGRAAARTFKKSIGQTLRLNDVGYRVVGIYETGINFEDGGAVITLADAQRTFERTNQVNYYNVRLKDPRMIDQVREAIEKRWPDLAATRSGEPGRQEEMLGLYRALGWVLGIFAVLVGGLGMMNTTLMSVFERTREIGVLRAIGWQKQRVIGLILGESLVIALAGGIAGIGLGLGLIWLASLAPAVSSLLSGVFTLNMLAQALVIALLLGTIGGVYPAWRAAQLQPIEAMRAESGAGVRMGRVTHWLATHLRGNTLRNLWRRPTRTLVTILGLGIGVGFVVALLAIVAGARSSFNSITGTGQIDLVAEQANASDLSLSAIDERVADRMRLRPEVKSVTKIILGTSNVPGLTFFIVYGVDPHDPYIEHYRIREGQHLQRAHQVMLGRFAANSLNKRVGEKLQIGGTSYLISGIFENGVSYEDAGGVITLDDAQRLFSKRNKLSLIGVTLHDPSTAAEVARQLEHDFPEVIVSQAANLTDRMQDFATLNATFGALTIITLLVSGIVMMNVMMMSVFERTQEIGVLRAVGWQRRRVLQMIMAESLVLSMFSGVAGLLIGVTLSWLVSLEPTFGSYLPPIFDLGVFAWAFLLTIALGVLGGLYPAWHGSGLRPVEALRYE